MHRKNTIGIALLIAAVGSACDTLETTDPLGGPQNAVVMPAEQATNPADVARAVPSFGGMFVDEFGRPTVYLTNLAEAPRARRVLSDFARDNGRAEEDIQFLQANFRMGQLNSWYDRTWPEVMEQAGTVFSDVDEASNRILFGVEGGLVLLDLPSVPLPDWVAGITLLKRMVWVIDDGTIVKVFYPVFPPDKSADEVMAWLSS